MFDCLQESLPLGSRDSGSSVQGVTEGRVVGPKCSVAAAADVRASSRCSSVIIQHPMFRSQSFGDLQLTPSSSSVQLAATKDSKVWNFNDQNVFIWEKN